MLVVTSIYIVLVQMVFLLGPSKLGDHYMPHVQLYDFPAHFRYQNELVLVVTAVVYTVLVQITRRFLDAKQRHRIEPV